MVWLTDSNTRQNKLTEIGTTEHWGPNDEEAKEQQDLR